MQAEANVLKTLDSIGGNRGDREASRLWGPDPTPESSIVDMLAEHRSPPPGLSYSTLLQFECLL